MATLEQIAKSLRAADKAGDVEAAKRLAAEYRRMQSQVGPTAEKGEVAAQAGPTQQKKALRSDERTTMLRNEYEAMPWYKQLPQALDDTARYGTDTATFGLADKLASVMSGVPLDEERQKTADARARSTGADIALDAAQIMKAPRMLGRLPGAAGIFGLGADAGLYAGAQSLGHDASYGEAAKDAAISGGLGTILAGALPLARGTGKLLADTSPIRSQGVRNLHAMHSVYSPATGIPTAAAHAGVGLGGAAVENTLASPVGRALQERLARGGQYMGVAPWTRNN